MVCIDSNIFIYSAQLDQESLRKWLKNQKMAASIITKIEVLGYHKITKNEIQLAEHYFSMCQILSLNNEIIALAIQLKQNKSMSLGDAIIAATALHHDLPLVTANIKDFKHNENLNTVNPLRQ